MAVSFREGTFDHSFRKLFDIDSNRFVYAIFSTCVSFESGMKIALFLEQEVHGDSDILLPLVKRYLQVFLCLRVQKILQTRTNERTNEWTNEQTNEQTNTWSSPFSRSFCSHFFTHHLHSKTKLTTNNKQLFQWLGSFIYKPWSSVVWNGSHKPDTKSALGLPTKCPLEDVVEASSSSPWVSTVFHREGFRLLQKHGVFRAKKQSDVARASQTKSHV